MTRILTILCCIVFITKLQAQTSGYHWITVTKDGYTYKTVTNDPMKTRFYTLKNGLTVILTVNRQEPKIQCEIAVRSGSNNDPADHTGLAHYLENMLLQ